MKRKIKVKISYFIKRKVENQNGNVKPHKHEKIKNTGRTKHKKKNKLARQKLALKRDVFNSKNCLIKRQLNVHRSQHNLDPLNFTFHATDRSKSSLFLGTIVQKGIITSILEAPAKSVRSNSQIGTLIIKSKAPKHWLQLLLKEQNSPKTPVRKLSTINNLYIRNLKKPLQKYYRKYSAKFLPRISARQE